MKYLFALILLTTGLNSVAQREWPAATPEEEGLSSQELNEMFNYVSAHHTKVHSIHVLRHGKLVLNTYFYPYSSENRHDVASVTKSVLSLLTGIAIDQGLIKDENQSLSHFFPEVKGSPKEVIRLSDLLTMRSGFDCGATLADPNVNLDRRLAEIRKCPNWIECALGLPMATTRGTQFAYCNANCHLISKILSDVTKRSAGEFAGETLFKPIGITDVYWPVDPQGVSYGWADVQLHPTDMLAIGQMVLQHGSWSHKQIVSNEWLVRSTRAHVTETGGHDQYGYFWWLPGGEYPDVVEAVGRGGQRITIWPSKDLVVVFTGGGFETSDLIPFIVRSIKSDQTLPRNDQAFGRLKTNVASVAKAPARTEAWPLPVSAAAISGKVFTLTDNTLGISEFRMKFSGRSESEIEFSWYGQRVQCKIGLDGVPRFSMNPIVRLTQACLGKWKGEQTFQLNLNLVGAINNYDLVFHFNEELTSVDLEASEITGLNNEKFKGSIVKK